MSSNTHASSNSDATDSATAPAISSAAFSECSTEGISASQLQDSSYLTAGPLCSRNSIQCDIHPATLECPAPSTAAGPAQLQHVSNVLRSPSHLNGFHLPNSIGPCTSDIADGSTTTAAAAVVTACPPGPAAAATSVYQGNAVASTIIEPPAATCPFGSVAGHAAKAVATDGREDGSVIINLALPADACRTASYSSTGTQHTRSWSSKPASMQDSFAQHILRAHQAKQNAIAQLGSGVLPLFDGQLQQGQQQQLEPQVKPVSCAACTLKLLATRLCALNPLRNKSSCSTRGHSASKVHMQHTESSSSAADVCKACWQLRLQELERYEMFLAAQLSASCNAEVQKQAMQAAGYSAYAFAVPGPSVALCADRYTTWAAFIEQLAQDKGKFEPCYTQYRENYVQLLAQSVAKQGGPLQASSWVAKLHEKASGFLALAFGPVQQWATAAKQQMCWGSVKQAPGSVALHVLQLLLLLIQCIYVPLTVVLVPFMWVGREITMTVEYTAKWLWDVWMAAVQTMVYMFAKGFHTCLE